MRKYLLEMIVFVSGAAVMILELVGSRILAPYVGTTILVWTSLIGIILASLSIGYWLGGIIADRHPRIQLLAGIIYLAGISIGFTSLIKEPFLSLLQENIASIRLSSILATLSLFSLPSILLGMVLPFSVRLKLDNLKHSGATTGLLYALSTLGSIVGTFLAGFFLISYLGHHKILVLLSIILMLFSVETYIFHSSKFKTNLVLLLLTGAISFLLLSHPVSAQTLVDIDTDYNRVILKEGRDGATGRPVLNLFIGNALDSVMFLDGNNENASAYLEFFRLEEHFRPTMERVLMIGGGGYLYPRAFLERNEGVWVDIVEIDPKVTQLAKEYFLFKEDGRSIVYREDARTFLNKSENIYDAIIVDVCDRAGCPFQLMTQEAIEEIYNLLEKDGIVVVNLVPSIEGPGGEVVRAVFKTYKTIFSQVYLFPVSNPQDGYIFQNVILVASKSDEALEFISEDPEISQYLSHLWTKDFSLDVPIFTDDFAPIDQYFIPYASKKAWRILE